MYVVKAFNTDSISEGVQEFYNLQCIKCLNLHCHFYIHLFNIHFMRSPNI